MPVMDGRRATELIRHWEHQRLTNARAAGPLPELLPEALRHNLLPIIFVTGNVMPGEEALMLSSGATKVSARENTECINLGRNSLLVCCICVPFSFEASPLFNIFGRQVFKASPQAMRTRNAQALTKRRDPSPCVDEYSRQGPCLVLQDVSEGRGICQSTRPELWR